MKKKWKLILMLAIVAAALFSAGVYILVFRTNVTVDYYIARGNDALEDGRFKSAVRSFETARKLDDSLPEIPIALASAYKGSGNYTKAEYTLVSAITEHPEQTELYVALSHTYVEQEKFLDADLMLSRAANDAVKSELSKLRPAAPTLTPDSGYFSTYITVSASCTAGRIFLTTDGDYPSSENDLYTEPVQLSGGETTVCALVVDDSGLVSPAVYAGYTIAGVIEPVTLTDPTLDTILRDAIDKGAEDDLMSNELWSIEELEISGAVSDLSQLSYLTGLKKLKISSVAATDYTVLAALPKLENLDLSGCVVSSASLESIGKLTELTSLNLSGCALKDISSLSGLVKLTTLDLSNNVISDISPLSKLPSLITLSLNNNPINNLQALSSCAVLESLNVSSCEITNLEALSEIRTLVNLYASDNTVASIQPLSNCTKLKELYVSSNEITDIAVLTELTSLTVFDGSYNSVSSIPDFGGSHPLQRINLNYNSVSGVKGLAGLSSLNYIQIDYNNVSDLSPLADCYNLVQVDAWGNPISKGVNTLQEHSIIVNYNPNT